MKLNRAFFCLLVLLVSTSAKASINTWQTQGVVIAPVSGDHPGQPNVLYETGAKILSGTVFKMWFTCGSSTCYAESTDGLSWTRYSSNPIIGAAFPKIYKSGSTYYAYVGFSSISVYTSTDGVTWSLAKANALTITQAWESLFLGQLAIAGQIGGTYYGYYASYDAGLAAYAEGQATSTDLVNWTKNVSNPVVTVGQPSNFFFQQIGSTYYGWSQIVQSGIPNFGSLSLPSDITRYTASSPAGPWTPLTTSTFYRTRSEEGVGSTKGQVADPTMVAANGNVYMYYTDATDGTGETTYQISCAIANSTTFGQLTQGYEGVFNVPIPTTTGFGYNLTQLATDNFTRANVNPIGGNWTSMISGHNAQIVSNLLEPSSLSTDTYVYWNALSWNADQWGSTMLAAANNDNAGVGLRENTGGANTTYRVFWTGPSGLGSNGTFFIVKGVAGVTTTLFSVAFLCNVSDNITGSMIGTTIAGYVNGNLISVKTDSAIASGSVGTHLYAVTSVGNAAISSWAGGSVQSPPGGGSYVSGVNPGP